MYKIGVFDSGMGGMSVAGAIQKAMPETEVFFTSDPEHFPYGNKSPEQLLGYVVPILEGLANEGCQVIVVACNTVSTTIIEDLRKAIQVPLIALEPMVKPAAEQTKSGVIAVCATPTTLASKRYAWLKDTYAKGIKVVEPDCSDWTSMIESKSVDRQNIKDRIEQACQAGADVIVLGCTHYHWIEDLITELAQGRAAIIQPEEPVIKQLKKILSSN